MGNVFRLCSHSKVDLSVLFAPSFWPCRLNRIDTRSAL